MMEIKWKWNDNCGVYIVLRYSDFTISRSRGDIIEENGRRLKHIEEKRVEIEYVLVQMLSVSVSLSLSARKREIEKERAQMALECTFHNVRSTDTVLYVW